MWDPLSLGLQSGWERRGSTQGLAFPIGWVLLSRGPGVEVAWFVAPPAPPGGTSLSPPPSGPPPPPERGEAAASGGPPASRQPEDTGRPCGPLASKALVTAEPGPCSGDTGVGRGPWAARGAVGSQVHTEGSAGPARPVCLSLTCSFSQVHGAELQLRSAQGGSQASAAWTVSVRTAGPPGAGLLRLSGPRARSGLGAAASGHCASTAAHRAVRV